MTLLWSGSFAFSARREPRTREARAPVAQAVADASARLRSRRGASCGTRSIEQRRRLLLGRDSDETLANRLDHPRHDHIEHLVESGRRLEAQNALGLLDRWHPPLHVMVERLVAHVAEGCICSAETAPDVLGKLQDRRRLCRRQVEIVVDCVWVLHRGHDASGEIATVRVVANLVPIPEDVERILALYDLLHQVRYDVTHRELHIAAEHLDVRFCSRLAYSDTVERPDDGVREPVLLVRRARE